MKTISAVVLLLLSSGVAYAGGGGYSEACVYPQCRASAYPVNGPQAEPRGRQQPAPSDRRQQPAQPQQQPVYTQGLTFYDMEPTKTLVDAAINVNLRHANRVAGAVFSAAAIGAGLSEVGGITQTTGTAVKVLSGTSSGLGTAPVDPPTPSVP